MNIAHVIFILMITLITLITLERNEEISRELEEKKRRESLTSQRHAQELETVAERFKEILARKDKNLMEMSLKYENSRHNGHELREYCEKLQERVSVLQSHLNDLNMI